MSFRGNRRELRENSETAKVGLKWTPEDDEVLAKQATENMDLDDIAKHHQRTTTGVNRFKNIPLLFQ